MFRCQRYFTILTCLSILTFTITSNADEEIEDLIYIAKSKNKIIAVIEGGNKISLGLQTKEKMLWRGSNGYLGALLTNHRFLVISTSSNAWQTYE